MRGLFYACNRKKEGNNMNNDQQFLIERIRTQYTEKEHTALDQLKALDAKVKRPANLFAYIFGSLGAIIMGCGMSLVMTDIANIIGLANPMVYGIIVGVIGMAMAVMNYPLYKTILGKRKKQYADQIIALSDDMIKD